MNELERRLKAAMVARAEAITEHDLTPATIPVPTTRPRRLPALVAAAAAALVVVGVSVSLAGGDSTRETTPAQTTTPTISAIPPTTTPPPMPPAPATTSPPPAAATSSAGPGTPSAGRSTEVRTPEPTCGGRECALVQTVSVAGDVLELLAAPDPRHGGQLADPVVRVRGGAALRGAPDFSMFVTGESLACQVVGGTPVCLLRTHYLGDSDTSLGLVKDRSGWRFTGARFPTPFGAVSVRAQEGPRVVAVLSRFLSEGSEPEKEWFTAQVFRWDGTDLGCSPRVGSREALPGWPDVAPDPAALAPGNCF